MSRLINAALILSLVMQPLVVGFAARAQAVEQTGTVRGVIHDAGGSMLIRDETNITVELYGGDQLTSPVMSKDLVSADYGAFEITGVPVGRYSVKFVSHTTYLVGEWWGDTRRASERAFIDVSDGGAVDLAVELSSTAHLEGSLTGRNVIFPSTGDPIKITATSGDSELDDWLPYRATFGSLIGYDNQPGSYGLFVLPGVYDVAFVDTTGAHRPLTVPGVVVAPPDTKRDVVLTAAWASISGTWALRTSAGIVPFGGDKDYGVAELYKWSGSDAAWLKVQSVAGGSTESQHFADKLDAGRYKFAVSYEGSLTFWGGGDLQTAPEIALTTGQTLNGIDVTVDDPATISGVIAVHYPDGTVHPVDSGMVRCWRKGTDGTYELVPGALRGYTTQGYTAGNGVFYGHLAAGTYIFRFWRLGDTSDGAVYSGGSRFFESATEVTVGLSEQRDFGAIVLPASSLDAGRLAGADRFATAVAISQQIVADGQRAPVVYLTSAYDFPDALSAGPAAAHEGGVILPVTQNRLPDAVASEVKRLRPKRVVLAGGTSAISDDVLTSVRSAVPTDATVERVGGATRYETADLIVRDAFSAGTRYAIIATGANYPDALAAGPAAAHLHAPVLLVDGQAGLDASTRAAIAKLGVTDVYIAGGTSVVSPSLESGLQAVLGVGHVTRLAGLDRFDTANTINATIFESSDDGFVASGAGYADALAGGPLAAKRDAPLYLAPQNCVWGMSVLGLQSEQVARVTLLGGTTVLSGRVASLTACS